MRRDKNLDVYYDGVIGPQSIHSDAFFQKRHYKRFMKYLNKWRDEIDSEGGILEWRKNHPHKRSFMCIWNILQTFIICGPKIHYDWNRKEWDWSDNIHLYGKMVKGKRFNLWDKFRFKLVTGVKYENN